MYIFNKTYEKKHIYGGSGILENIDFGKISKDLGEKFVQKLLTKASKPKTQTQRKPIQNSILQNEMNAYYERLKGGSANKPIPIENLLLKNEYRYN